MSDLLFCGMCGFKNKNAEEFLRDDESVEYRCPKCRSRMVMDDEEEELCEIFGQAS